MSETRMAEAEAFAATLRKAGREVWIYQGKLRVTGWWKPEERAFVNAHRAELRAIAAQRSTGRRAAARVLVVARERERARPAALEAASASVRPATVEAPRADSPACPEVQDAGTEQAPRPVSQFSAPDIRINGIRISEEDVTEALQQLGDEVLADYRIGRLSQAAAYDIARRRITQCLGIIGRTQHHTHVHDINVSTSNLNPSVRRPRRRERTLR